MLRQSPLTLPYKRVSRSLQGLLRFHDWHLISITLYWPKQVTELAQLLGTREKSLPFNKSIKTIIQRVWSWGMFAITGSLHWQLRRGSRWLRLAFKGLNETFLKPPPMFIISVGFWFIERTEWWHGEVSAIERSVFDDHLQPLKGGGVQGHLGKHRVCKERLRNCHRLEGTKAIWQLSAVWDPGLDLGTEKGH